MKNKCLAYGLSLVLLTSLFYENEKRSYVAPVTKNITKEISDYLFTK